MPRRPISFAPSRELRAERNTWVKGPAKKMTEMKPRERPSASPPNAGSFDGTLGSDPEHQDRPHRWLGSSTLHWAGPYVPTLT
jgi:hypothetical protein